MPPGGRELKIFSAKAGNRAIPEATSSGLYHSQRVREKKMPQSKLQCEAAESSMNRAIRLNNARCKPDAQASRRANASSQRRAIAC
jgi:hypothetical protein